MNKQRMALVFTLAAAGAFGLQACLNVNGYKKTILVSNTEAIPAAHHDPNLVNPWGLVFGPEFSWIANNGTNTSTLYDGKGVPQSLVVTIPPGEAGPAAPTGIVFNDSADFEVTANGVTGPAAFIFTGQGGTIAGWSGAPGFGTAAVTVYDGSDEKSVYTGLALLETGGQRFLYAADFRNAEIETFDSHFTEIESEGGFEDPDLPAGYAPFNIQAVKDVLIVTYAKQSEELDEEEAGAGLGYVDAFDGSGHLIKRLVSQGKLNAPWGVALAPHDFGVFSDMLLIGNFGDGTINAYDPDTGEFAGTVQDLAGKPVVIEGLWALQFGNGKHDQPTNTLFFTAGTNDEKDGSYGRLDVLAVPGNDKKHAAISKKALRRGLSALHDRLG